MSARRVLVAIGGAATLAVLPQSGAIADTPATFRLAPTSTTVHVGGQVTVQVRLGTGSHQVNTAQLYLTFPDRKLDCLQIRTPAAGPYAAEQTAANSCPSSNTAAFSAYTGGGTPSWSAGTTGVFAKVTFTALLVGHAHVSFDQTRSLVVDADTNQNVLGSTNSMTINVVP